MPPPFLCARTARCAGKPKQRAAIQQGHRASLRAPREHSENAGPNVQAAGPLIILAKLYAASLPVSSVPADCFFSSYFGMGRKIWNSMSAAMTMATTVQMPKLTSPNAKPTNW